MELWKLLTNLQGKVLKTLAHGRSFSVLSVNQYGVTITPHRTQKTRLISMKEIDCSYRKLKAIGHITRVEIEDEFSPRNPAYVAAILSTVPGIKTYRKPIITLEYKP